MPIYHVGSSGGISDQGERNQNQFSGDSADAEEQLIKFLLIHFELTEQQARKTLSLLIDSGEDIEQLAQGIENCDERTISKIELYIP